MPSGCYIRTDKHRKQISINKTGKYKYKRIKINCKYCNTQFEIPENYNRNFCSTPCSNKYHSKLSSIRAKSNKNPWRHKTWNKGIPLTDKQKKKHSIKMKEYYKKQEVCITDEQKDKQRKTRSIKMTNYYDRVKKNKNIKKIAGFQNGNKTKSQFKKGKENPNYIDGRKYFNYPEEFNNELKIKILKRDNFKCKWCNTDDNCKGKLSVHHIDYNKKNCNPDNLITLCMKHNSKANFNRDYYKKYFINLIMSLYEKTK